MDDSPPPLPVALNQMLDALQERGFAESERHYDAASFGNQVIELTGPPASTATAVRVIRDRGLWGVEIQLDGGEWFRPYELLEAMKEAPYSTRALSHVERRDMTLEAVDNLPGDRHGVSQVYERLLAYRREYTRQFLAEPDASD